MDKKYNLNEITYLNFIYWQILMATLLLERSN